MKERRVAELRAEVSTAFAAISPSADFQPLLPRFRNPEGDLQRLCDLEERVRTRCHGAFVEEIMQRSHVHVRSIRHLGLGFSAPLNHHSRRTPDVVDPRHIGVVHSRVF